MTSYRAIVSIEFDDDDLKDLADDLDIDVERPDPNDVLFGALQNLEIGNGWIEQMFADGEPQIVRLGEGILVEINPHN